MCSVGEFVDVAAILQITAQRADVFHVQNCAAAQALLDSHSHVIESRALIILIEAGLTGGWRQVASRSQESGEVAVVDGGVVRYRRTGRNRLRGLYFIVFSQTDP